MQKDTNSLSQRRLEAVCDGGGTDRSICSRVYTILDLPHPCSRRQSDHLAFAARERTTTTNLSRSMSTVVIPSPSVKKSSGASLPHYVRSSGSLRI
jgi:hypothetical protein